MTNKEWGEALLSVLLEKDKPSIWIEEQRKNGNLKEFFPELLNCYAITQNKFHKYDVYHHLLYSCDAAIKKIHIRLSALFHDIGKAKTQRQKGNESTFYNHEIVGAEIVYQILNRWEVDIKLIKKVVLLVRHHMFHYIDEWRDKAVRRILKKVGFENMENLFLLRVADREGNGFRQGEPMKLKDFRERIGKVLEEENRFKIKDLNISGNDIIKMGIEPGPFIGEVLKYLYSLVIDKRLENEESVLIKEAKEFIDDKI